MEKRILYGILVVLAVVLVGLVVALVLCLRKKKSGGEGYQKRSFQKQLATPSQAPKRVVAFIRPDGQGNCNAGSVKMSIDGKPACRSLCWDTDPDSGPNVTKCQGYPDLTYSNYNISGQGQNFNNFFYVLDDTGNRCDALSREGVDKECCTGGGQSCDRGGKSFGWNKKYDLFPYNYGPVAPPPPKMINGAWVAPTHVVNINPSMLKGWVTDLMIGYYVDLSDTRSPKSATNSTLKMYNGKVVDFLNVLKGLDAEMRIWIIIFNDEFSGEIGSEAMKMAKNNKWGKVMSVIAGGMGADLMNRFSGIIVDWEKHEKPKGVAKYEVQAMIDIHKQVRAVYPRYGLRINLPNYQECLEGVGIFTPDRYQDWCPDGPSTVTYHEFLSLPDTYFDFQSYGTNINNDYGCKADNYPGACFGPDGNCSVSHIDKTLHTRLDYIKCNMCEHVNGSGGKNFLASMLPAERARITIGTYPTTPTGLLDIYQQVWRPYGFQGYWMFDVLYLSGCGSGFLDQYRATVKQIRDDLISRPMSPVSIDWKCSKGRGQNQDCDTIGK